MPSLTESTQQAARQAVPDGDGMWNEDVIAQLRTQQSRGDGHINELFSAVPGGLAQFLLGVVLNFVASLLTLDNDSLTLDNDKLELWDLA